MDGRSAHGLRHGIEEGRRSQYKQILALTVKSFHFLCEEIDMCIVYAPYEALHVEDMFLNQLCDGKMNALTSMTYCFN